MTIDTTSRKDDVNTDTKLRLMVHRLARDLREPTNSELGARLEDIAVVATTAEDSIRDTMLTAAGKHAVGSWKSEGFEHHIGRATMHLAKLCNGDTTEPHLDHAVCRLVMAMLCRRADR